MTQHEPPHEEPEQLVLDLEFPTYSEYTIRLCQDDDYDVIVLDETKTSNGDLALKRIAEYRDLGTASGVTWSDHPAAGGRIFGIGPGGIIHYITVFPALSFDLVQQ